MKIKNRVGILEMFGILMTTNNNNINIIQIRKPLEFYVENPLEIILYNLVNLNVLELENESKRI